MRLIGLALLVAGCGWAQQADDRLAALHENLRLLHDEGWAAAIHPATGPRFTVAKHQLRDWIESQLGTPENETIQDLAARLNEALQGVGVEAADDPADGLGRLGSVDVTGGSSLLIVVAGLGIPCATDESAYGYRKVDGRWQRVWESEQNDYSTYRPQEIQDIRVQQSYEEGRPEGPAYILTLGNSWGCASAWHDVYYRIWRVDDRAAKLLVDGSETGYLRASSYLQGSIAHSAMLFSGPVDALIEFTQASIDPGVHNREAVRHYLIEGDQVRRVAPVALSPRDFVDEWLTSSWMESQEWSAGPDLADWHSRLRGNRGEFLGVTMFCRTPNLWQVGLEFSASKNYFLVRWTPPYRFALVAVRAQPSPLCTEPDPEADEWRTLFSTQDWRY